MSLRNWILLAVLGAIWGGSFLFAKVAVAEIPPFVLKRFAFDLNRFGIPNVFFV